MGYGSKDLNDRRDEALKIAVDHGFSDATVGEDVALICSEAAELLEDHRDGHAPTRIWYEEKRPAFDEGGDPLMVDGKHASVVVRHDRQIHVEGKPKYKPCGIPSEVADIIIRCLHFSGKHGIDIEAIVRDKLAYNETRPFKHGKKL